MFTGGRFGMYWKRKDSGLLVNPVQVKALAGRKSDGRDAQRIAEYLQDGRLGWQLCSLRGSEAVRTWR